MDDFLCDMTETLTDYKEIISGLLKEIEELKAAYSKLNEEYSSLRRRYQCTANELRKSKKELKQANKLLEKHGIKRPEKTSKNSSTPPSKESIHASATRRTKSIREPSGLSQGGQRRHEGSTLMTTEEPSCASVVMKVPKLSLGYTLSSRLPRNTAGLHMKLSWHFLVSRLSTYWRR